jgi:hypothetical protein
MATSFVINRMTKEVFNTTLEQLYYELPAVHIVIPFVLSSKYLTINPNTIFGGIIFQIIIIAIVPALNHCINLDIDSCFIFGAILSKVKSSH